MLNSKFIQKKKDIFMAKKIIELLADIDVDMIEYLIRLSQRKLIKSDLPSAKAKDLK